MPAWLVKTRRAPSRYSRDARVYGHTTTAMHNLSTPPTPPLACLCSVVFFNNGHGSYRAHSLIVPPPLFLVFLILFFVSDGHGDYRVRLENGESGSPAVGAFYRDEKGVALAMGTLQNPQSRERLRRVRLGVS